MPRVEYALSFENYLEMTESRREPKYKAAAVSALVGLCCIAAGYTYLRILPDTRSIIGGSLLALGLLATFLAVPLAFLAKPRSSRPDTATLRGQYERFHADRRAIEWDEAGWRVFWYEGEDVRPWSCLRAVHDQKSLLVLSTETTHYWLPKAALERDGQLENIKGLAEGVLKNHELLFTVPMRPSAPVYVSARIFHNWRLHLKTLILSYAGATLLLYWIFFSDWDAAWYSPWLLSLTPVVLLACESLYYLGEFCFLKWSDAAREARIMSDCIGYESKVVQFIVNYRALSTVKEPPGAFLLYFDRKTFHLIPKKGFSPDRVVQFRKLTSAHL